MHNIHNSVEVFLNTVGEKWNFSFYLLVEITKLGNLAEKITTELCPESNNTVKVFLLGSKMLKQCKNIFHQHLLRYVMTKMK